MENVQAIADWFLSQSSMTHKKLQKLCYYAQAWYCALYDGTPLFADEIQAWIHGPVVASLYHSYADYKWQPIPQKECTCTLDEQILSVLSAVYETYGSFTGDQLENLTHSEKPWIQARGTLPPWEPCTKAISCESMRDFYAKQYEQAQND